MTESAERFGPDWDDVLRRARLRRSQRAGLIAAVVAIVVAAPALAIADGVIDFSSAPTVPAPVSRRFREARRDRPAERSGGDHRRDA